MAARPKPRQPKKAPKEETVPIEVLPNKDVLDDFFFHAADYIYRFRKLFIGLVIAVAVIFVVSYSIYWFLGYRDNQRSVALYKIERIINNKKLEEKARNKIVLPKLEQFISDYSGSKQAIIALFYRAGINFKKRRLKESEKDFRRVIQELDKGTAFQIMAAISLANVLQDQGNSQESLAVLEAAKSELMVDSILMEMAEVYLSMNQRDEAQKVLEILIKDYPSSIHAQRAQIMLTIY